MVIIRNGRMIWRGPEAAKAQGVWSVTKAFTSTAQGLLIEDGKCTLDTLAKDYDPALAKYYPTVTLRHFATMTCGLVLPGLVQGHWIAVSRRPIHPVP